jgi:hypothetical protein
LRVGFVKEIDDTRIDFGCLEINGWINILGRKIKGAQAKSGIEQDAGAAPQGPTAHERRNVRRREKLPKRSSMGTANRRRVFFYCFSIH